MPLILNGSTGVSGVDGSAGTPSYQGGDTNTGIFYPAADTIAFAEGGAEVMRIDSSGNVGIGTVSPSVKLEVSGRVLGDSLVAGNAVYIWSQNRMSLGASYGIESQQNSPLFMLTQGVAQPIVFGTNGTERMRITSAGDVGIGTSSPSEKLSVTGNVTATGTNTSATYFHRSIAPATESNIETSLITTGNGANQRAGLFATNDYTNTLATGLIFKTNATTGGATERMRIDSSGNVGIGGTPQEILTVYGTTFNNGSNSIVTSFWSKNATIAEGSGYCQWNTSELAFKVGAYTGSPCIFVTNNIERMRITSGGEVYIAGTTDQGAYNLQCNGTGVWGAGAYVNGSDERIKDNIAPIDSGLDVVAKLNPVTYKYKEDWSKDQSTQTGFIAQELLTALEGKNYVDGVVQQGGQYMSVAYQNIIPILTKAIQEQQTLIENLTTRLNALEGN
jgi:hypothetical protein